MKQLRLLVLPLIAVALLVVGLLAAPDHAEQPRDPTTVAAVQSTYACPAASVITVASGQVRSGRAARATVLPGRTADPALSDASAWRSSVVDGAGVVVQQRGRGSGAVGFFAGTAPKAGGGGLVVGSCPGIVDDAWIMGLGSGGKHFSTLILTNLAGSPAAVDLTLWGPKGRIDAVGAKGVVVEPHSVRRIRLDTLAAGEAELAMHVHRRRGSLSAVVNDSSTSTFRGTEPVTPTLSPRRSQVVGGLVEGSTGRTLLLLNPGGATARVAVKVVGPDNTFTPSGLDNLKVPAGSLRAVAVPASAGSAAQALSVTSDQPVSATVRMAPDTKDYAYAEAVPPLAGPAVVPISIGPGVGVPDLVLSAPGRAASARVRTYDAQMRPLDSSTVQLAAGTTRRVAVEGKGAAYAVVTPRGRVVAAATYDEGDGLSSLALAAAPVSVLGPQVRPAP